MKKSVFTVFSTIVLGASLVACSESTIEPVEKEAEPTTEETAPEETAPEEAAEEKPAENLKVGDTVDYNGMQVTVNSVRQYNGSADTFDEPTNDYYLVFDVAIENTGSEPVNISSMMNFQLYDSEAYAQELSIFVDTKGALDGEIGAGRKMAGEIAFDVVDSETFEFIFEDPFAGGQAIWNISKEDITQ